MIAEAGNSGLVLVALLCGNDIGLRVMDYGLHVSHAPEPLHGTGNYYVQYGTIRYSTVQYGTYLS